MNISHPVLNKSANRTPLGLDAWLLWLALGALLIWSGNLHAEAARCSYSLSYPESGAQVIDPGSVTCDMHTGETFVTDVRNQRIVIFDRFGHYNFDFSNAEHLAGLRQVAVDSQGRIYVLRSSVEANLSVFDYNGEYLHDLRLTMPETDKLADIGSVAMDEQDRLYALAVMPAQLLVYTAEGQLLNNYVLFAELDSSTQYQPFYGSMAFADGDLVIPIPMEASVARYTTDGKFVQLFGASGGGPGELSFPVAASGDQNGNIWVLDKHRHSLLQYNEHGKFVRELGGRGTSPGWFYHPTSLACNAQGEAIVAQTFLGRIQAISISAPAVGNNAYTTADPMLQK